MKDESTVDLTPEFNIDDHEFNGVTPVSLDIKIYPDECLYADNAEVTEFDDELKTLIFNMFYTMRKNNGIGLAAPQVGVNKQLCIIMLEKPMILINPKLIIVGVNDWFEFEEGCLSTPGFFAMTKRHRNIRVGYQNEDGEPLELKATELAAFAIQHELDHLDGKIFVDDLSLLKRMRVKKKIKKTLERMRK